MISKDEASVKQEEFSRNLNNVLGWEISMVELVTELEVKLWVLMERKDLVRHAYCKLMPILF